MRPRRALLYTPGDDLRKIQKTTTLDVDCICLDMEDAVAENRKGAARQIIADALIQLDFERSERLARINSVGSGFEEEDLQAVLPSHPEGIVIPKIETAEQVKKVSGIIADHENKSGWPAGEIGVLVVVESAAGILNLKEIAASDSRLQAIIFGAEDYTRSIGAVRTRENLEVLFARSMIIACAAASGLQALDMVYLDFKDPRGLYQEALSGSKMGFDGKQIIHPDQIKPVQEAFTPDESSIAEALRILEHAAKFQAEGKGAFALDGRMIDAPIIKQAENVLILASTAGKIKGDLPFLYTSKH